MDTDAKNKINLLDIIEKSACSYIINGSRSPKKVYILHQGLKKIRANLKFTKL